MSEEIKKENECPICQGENCECAEGEIAPWLEVAKKEYEKYKGKKETDKELKEQIEQKYFPAAKWQGESHKEAWCAAFISYCMKESKGFVNSSDPSCGGLDWLPGRRADFKKRGWLEGEETEKFVGAIAVFKRNKGYNHVAIIVGKDTKGNYVFLGGNQNNEINQTSYSESRVLKYTKPKDYTVKEYEKVFPIIKDPKGAGSVQ
ncbi:MAG: CHAP domain-containing protein [Pseudoleptotrichia goodfellowii]|nr:CHAP domain-containing protein [Pseudoleptotrichia goodfellowii]